MSHVLQRLPEASPAQLDVAMGMLVGSALVMALLLFFLLRWTRRKKRGATRESRTSLTKAPQRRQRRSG